MKSNPLISIIIPVYNVEPFIRRCLDSIINQTYSNLEIVLIDDGSTDRSGLICDEYKNKDKRITIIHQKNQGLSMARNAGLNICKGEYIVFVDSDDFVDPKFVEILHRNLIKNNADISICSAFEIIDNNLTNMDLCGEGIISYKSIKRPFVWNKLYKKELFIDIRFKANSYCEDLWIFYPLLSRARKIVGTLECLYYYNRCNSASITHITNNKSAIDRCEAYSSMLIFSSKNDVNDDIINIWFKSLLYIFFLYYQQYHKNNLKEFRYLLKIVKRAEKSVSKHLIFKHKFAGKWPIVYYRLRGLLKYKIFRSIYSLIKH